MAKSSVFVDQLGKDVRSQNLIGVFREKIANASFDMMANRVRAANDALSVNRERRNAMGGYFDVTGNMFASMGFLISRYDKGKHRRLRSRQYAPISHNKRPTRPSLKLYEIYGKEDGMTRYYDGTPVDERHAAMGMTRFADNGYDNGTALRLAFIQYLTKKDYGISSDLWTVYCFIAMPYARYVEERLRKRGRFNSTFVQVMVEYVKNTW